MKKSTLPLLLTFLTCLVSLALGDILLDKDGNVVDQDEEFRIIFDQDQDQEVENALRELLEHGRLTSEDPQNEKVQECVRMIVKRAVEKAKERAEGLGIEEDEENKDIRIDVTDKDFREDSVLLGKAFARVGKRVVNNVFIDPDDFQLLEGDEEALESMSLGLVLLHELKHIIGEEDPGGDEDLWKLVLERVILEDMLEDPEPLSEENRRRLEDLDVLLDQKLPKETGKPVDEINEIRKKLGLPQRSRYFPKEDGTVPFTDEDGNESTVDFSQLFKDHREEDEAGDFIDVPPGLIDGIPDKVNPERFVDPIDDFRDHFAGTRASGPRWTDIRSADLITRLDRPESLILDLELYDSVPSHPEAHFVSWHFLLDLDGDINTGHPGDTPPVGVFPGFGVDVWADLIFNGSNFTPRLFLGPSGIKTLTDSAGLLKFSLRRDRSQVTLELPLRPLEQVFPDLERGNVNSARIAWVVVTNYCATIEDCQDPPSDFFPNDEYSPRGIRTLHWVFQGSAHGGTVRATLTGATASCTVEITTTPGESATIVAYHLAAAINADPCLSGQGITAIVQGASVLISGVDLRLEETLILDPGLQHLQPSIPTLSSWGIILLCGLLLAAGRIIVKRKEVSQIFVEKISQLEN